MALGPPPLPRAAQRPAGHSCPLAGQAASQPSPSRRGAARSRCVWVPGCHRGQGGRRRRRRQPACGSRVRPLGCTALPRWRRKGRGCQSLLPGPPPPPRRRRGERALGESERASWFRRRPSSHNALWRPWVCPRLPAPGRRLFTTSSEHRQTVLLAFFWKAAPLLREAGSRAGAGFKRLMAKRMSGYWLGLNPCLCVD